VPLPTKTKLLVSNKISSEAASPILLAKHFGLFDEENLDVEFTNLALSDALGGLDNCDIDFASGGTEAAVFNSINNGLKVNWVAANFFPPAAGDTSVPQTGLWARRDVFSDPQHPDIAELEGKKIASATGPGSVIAYPIAKALDSAGVSMTDVQVEQIPSADQPQALENGAIDAAWLLDPFWTEIAASPDTYVLLATQPPAEPLGGMFAGPCVQPGGSKQAAGAAFMRAYIRAINTYLTGDYHHNADTVAAIAQETGSTPEKIEAAPSLTFDWEIRSYTTDELQKYFGELGALKYSEPLPVDQVVHPDLYRTAVGAQ